MSKPFIHSRRKKASDLAISAKVASRAKTRRIELGLTQIQVGPLVGQSNHWVSYFETGQSMVTLPVLLSPCEALETSPNDLLGWEARP